MKELFIFGAGDLAEIAADAFSSLKNYKVKQFIVSDDIYNSKFRLNPFLEGIEIVSESNFLDQGTHNESFFFAAIGYSKLNKERERIYLKMKGYGLHAATYISKTACIGSKVSIGEGSLVLEENNIQYQAQVGKCVIMWSGNHVGHHSSVGDYAFITSHVVVSGRVNIGNHTFLGVNSLIGDNISIGSSCIIGAGAKVLKSINKDCVVAEKSTELSKIPSNKVKI